MKRDVAIIGAGYVGVPLAQVFADAGRTVVLVDVKQDLVDALNRGESHIEDIPSEQLKAHVDAGRISATLDYDVVREADAVLVALATPLTKQREPDLSIVLEAVRGVVPRLREGHLLVLESTTYPGTTRECVLPLLERTGLKVGEDFFVAYSPERVDPGREDWTTKNVPKVVGGITEACTRRAAELYLGTVDEVIELSSPEAAELAKRLENIFRSVNIAPVNELGHLSRRMATDG